MQKVNKISWLVLAILSVLVGIILVLTEPLAHSKFYLYFILSLLFLFFWWKTGKGAKGKKAPKSKKS